MEIILDLISATGPASDPLTVLIFAVLLILASQRIEDIMGWDLDTDTTKASLKQTKTAIAISSPIWIWISLRPILI